MTVESCIEHYTSRPKKLTSLWICPKEVKNGKIGKNYTCECGITCKLDPSLIECEVNKHWIENTTLCIVYVPKDEPIIFSS